MGLDCKNKYFKYTVRAKFNFQDKKRISLEEQQFYFDFNGVGSIAIGDTRTKKNDFKLVLYSQKEIKKEYVEMQLKQKLNGLERNGFNIEILSFKKGAELFDY